MAFNFAKISNIVSKIMDSDYVDIKRDIDGSLKEIYSNIPCHIAYDSVDNANPSTFDIKPIIQTITIHIPLYVDVENNDFLVAKKTSANRDVIAVYSGRCGNPVVSQARKKVSMLMKATEPEVPTPVPSLEDVEFIYDYVCNDVAIKDSTREYVEVGTYFHIVIPSIVNYVGVAIVVNDITYETDSLDIMVENNDYLIKFVYELSSVFSTFRFLVNGLYTKDDGSLAKGYHQYKPILANSIVFDGDVCTVNCDKLSIEHEDNGKILQIKLDTLLVIGDVFVKVESVTDNVDTITFIARRFEPNFEQANSYICNWYG